MNENLISADSQEEYEKALEDFKRRLVMIERPKDVRGYDKYAKKISGIWCIPALINEENKEFTMLPDDFVSPFDNLSLWIMAIKNGEKRTRLGDRLKSNDGKETELVYVSSNSGRAAVCMYKFWDGVCREFGAVRLMVSFYHKENEMMFITVAAVDDGMDINICEYLSKANREDENRTTYIYVKGAGMLSEAALNSEE